MYIYTCIYIYTYLFINLDKSSISYSIWNSNPQISVSGSQHDVLLMSVGVVDELPMQLLCLRRRRRFCPTRLMMIYPLVNGCITTENHHFFMGILSILSIKAIENGH